MNRGHGCFLEISNNTKKFDFLIYLFLKIVATPYTKGSQ